MITRPETFLDWRGVERPTSDLKLTPYCRVCGWAVSAFSVDESKPETWRCERHPNRNPCAIEGCKRSSAASELWSGLALWLCAEHWRLGCPPRSPERKVYRRLFRIEKRHGLGWYRELNARYWRVWNRIVARARSRAAGDIDVREINRIMGW